MRARLYSLRDGLDTVHPCRAGGLVGFCTGYANKASNFSNRAGRASRTSIGVVNCRVTLGAGSRPSGPALQQSQARVHVAGNARHARWEARSRVGGPTAGVKRPRGLYERNTHCKEQQL
jgi:hypothetical protein